MSIPLGLLTFHSHTNHNPDCDILEMYWDRDTSITFGVYVKGNNIGHEFCEYYRGPNYRVGSLLKKSYSRSYEFNNLPPKFKPTWLELKALYYKTYKYEQR